MKTVLVLVLVLSNAAWLYLFVDRSVTIDHQREAARSNAAERDLVMRLARDLHGMSSRTEVEGVLRQRYGKHIVKSDGDTIYVDDIGVVFEKGLFAGFVRLDS